jgi:hypothetical protein
LNGDEELVCGDSASERQHHEGREEPVVVSHWGGAQSNVQRVTATILAQPGGRQCRLGRHTRNRCRKSRKTGAAV